VRTIVQVRGTHGSGKSTAVRSLLKTLGPATGITAPGERKLLGYQLNGARVVGSYETECGGCDGITKQDDITARVRAWAREGSVVFEGILASKTHQRYADLRDELVNAGCRYIFAYLNTPLVECLKRVGARRFNRGEAAPLNPANVVSGYEAVLKVRQKTIDAGFHVIDLDWRDAERQLAALVKGA
jgi:hypothetical protein